MLLVWLKFIFLLIIIYIFGRRVTRSADIIAEKKALGRAFMGVIFISMITSFPELFTGMSASAIVDSPDMAVGEIIGSCIFNFFIIAIIEVFFRKENLFTIQEKQTFLPFGFSFILIFALVFAISLRSPHKILHIGYFSLLLLLLYLVFIYILFRERRVEPAERRMYDNKKLGREVISFAVSSVIIILVGGYLPVVGKELAGVMGWQDAFVGVIFLSFVTSFPELVVSVAAARMGALDLILGNIAGSNLFNIAIIFFIDALYLKGAILSQVSPKYVQVGLIALMMNFVIVFAIIRRSRTRIFKLLSINGLVLLFLYIVNLIIIY